MLTDTHAHLYYENLFEDIENVLERAVSAGVDRIIVPAVDLITSEKILSLADKYDMIFAAVGFHPCDIKCKNISEIKFLEDFITHEKVVAIGEIGLDYYWDKTNTEVQKSFFLSQIELASDVNLPVIIHTRDSIKDAISILKNFNEIISGQFHCFSGDENDVAEILGFENFYFSFCGNITYKKFSGSELINLIPAEKLLAETDSPFLTPEPFRGRKNEPANVIYTVRKIAGIKKLDFELFSGQLQDNTLSLFKKLNRF